MNKPEGLLTLLALVLLAVGISLMAWAATSFLCLGAV